MTLTDRSPQLAPAEKPALVDVDAFIEDVKRRYTDRGEIAPIWYLILAGGAAEYAGIFDREKRSRAKRDIGQTPFHPQTYTTWDQVNWSDHRLLTRQEFYQPLKQRLALFTYRNPQIVLRLSEEVGDTYTNRLAEDHAFTESLYSQLQQHGYLTIRQIESLESYWAKKDAKPDVEPAPAGRLTVTGVVKTVREEHGKYGPMTKMLVTDDTGYTTWGTVPKNLDAQPGDTVQFDATIQPAAEVGHSYFSRPTKAKLVPDQQPSQD